MMLLAAGLVLLVTQQYCDCTPFDLTTGENKSGQTDYTKHTDATPNKGDQKAENNENQPTLGNEGFGFTESSYSTNGQRRRGSDGAVNDNKFYEKRDADSYSYSNSYTGNQKTYYSRSRPVYHYPLFTSSLSGQTTGKYNVGQTSYIKNSEAIQNKGAAVINQRAVINGNRPMLGKEGFGTSRQRIWGSDGNAPVNDNKPHAISDVESYSDSSTYTGNQQSYYSGSRPIYNDPSYAGTPQGQTAETNKGGQGIIHNLYKPLPGKKSYGFSENTYRTGGQGSWSYGDSNSVRDTGFFEIPGDGSYSFSDSSSYTGNQKTHYIRSRPFYASFDDPLHRGNSYYDGYNSYANSYRNSYSDNFKYSNSNPFWDPFGFWNYLFNY